jgi:transposase-like protein
MVKVCEKTGIPLCTLQPALKKLGLSRSHKEVNKRHTPEMLEQAIELYKSGKTMHDVSLITKVSRYTLSKEIDRLNIKHEIPISKQPMLEKSIELYKNGSCMLTVCDMTGISIACLSRHLKRLGLSRSNKENSRKYQVNNLFFQKIDTENKAYWLGFMYADGFITCQRFVGCSLHEKDLAHLQKFKHALEATYEIRHYINKSFGVEVPYVRLLMTSWQLFADLITKGVVERKSLVLTFPSENIVPNNLVHHFIRGYFDGDGSFSKSHDGYKFKLCGTKELLNSVANQIGHPNVKLYKRHKDSKKNNYQFDIGGRLQVVKIGDFMYNNASVFLDRKYQRYVELRDRIV